MPAAFDRPAVTVGTFDGVHRGHRSVLDQLIAWATQGGVAPVVITFDQHPRKVLGRSAPPLLTTLEHRLHLLGESGVAGVVVLPFDDQVASWSPETYVSRVLVSGLGASRVLVGRNHRFGQGGRGDFALLQALGAQHAFQARALELQADGEPISSTRIRRAIAAGELEAAARLLGRPVTVRGRVIRGDQRGRTLGFPTANLSLPDSALPPRGVYVARARLPESGPRAPLLPAVLNIGRRPTFKPNDPDLIEVHLLAGGSDIYDQLLEVQFLEKLRDERRFSGPDELVAQIAADVRAAQAALDLLRA